MDTLREPEGEAGATSPWPGMGLVTVFGVAGSEQPFPVPAPAGLSQGREEHGEHPPV